MIELSEFGKKGNPTSLNRGSIFDSDYFNKIDQMLTKNDENIESNILSLYPSSALNDIIFTDHENYMTFSINSSGFASSIPNSTPLNYQCIYYDGQNMTFLNMKHQINSNPIACSGIGNYRCYTDDPIGNYTVDDQNTYRNSVGIPLKGVNIPDYMTVTGVFIEGSINIYMQDYADSNLDQHVNPWQQWNSYEYFTPILGLYCNGQLVQRFDIRPEYNYGDFANSGGICTENSGSFAGRMLNVGFYLAKSDLSAGINLRLKSDLYEVPITGDEICNVENDPKNMTNMSRSAVTYDDLKNKISKNSGLAVQYNPIGIDYSNRTRDAFWIKNQNLMISSFGEV